MFLILMCPSEVPHGPPLGSWHTAQGQGFVLLWQHWLIALSLSMCPVVLLSQTCHLTP